MLRGKDLFIIIKFTVRHRVRVHDERRDSLSSAERVLLAERDRVERHAVPEIRLLSKAVRDPGESVLLERADRIPVVAVRRRHEDVGRDAVRREDLPASADKLTLLLIGEARELREVVQREEAAALRRVDVVAAVHRDGPAFGAERFDHVKEVRPRRADVQGRVPVVRHDADQRLHIVSRTERPEPVKFLPVHSGRDVIHSNCDLHTYRLLIQGPCRV